MSRNNLEMDCMRRCKSRNHGQALTSAITKRSVTDQALASFMRATCANFIQAIDFEGRTALHMAASRGRAKLTDWLARLSSDELANARDLESGYTPLHRSIFYGQIHAAVALLKIGVNTEILDKDDYRALEHAMLDRQYMYKQRAADPSEVYVWGSNSNYTLGTGAQQQRNTPELLGCFSRTNTCVKQVCLGKFHAVWVCAGGEAWCCGQVARAGAAHATALRPAPLRLPEPCACAAVTLHSTVFLLHSGAIIQHTLNNADAAAAAMSGQAASKAPPHSAVRVSSVKPLMKLSEPLGVRAGRWHAVVWNARAAYTWGTNLGQLGHSQGEKEVPTPKRVAISMNNKEEAGIQLVDASDAATVLTTSRGDVYLLHKHICKKIAIKQINLRQVCVEARVNEQGACPRVTVLLLTSVGQLLLWQDSTNALTRCVFGLAHQTVVAHVALTHDALYFTTNYGEAYVGSISRRAAPARPQPARRERDRDGDSAKSALVKFLEKDDCTCVRVARIPNVHRAVSIAVNSEGLNFACLQIKPTCGLRTVPELSPSCLPKHMQALLETASEDDLLHDVVFKVGQKLYPAHVYVVASSSEHLLRLYREQLAAAGGKPTLVLDHVLPEVFERVLRYMYTGTCDVTELGPCGLRVRREDLPPAAAAEGRDSQRLEDADAEVIGEFKENPMEVSAFEVHKSERTKRKGRRTARPPDAQPRRHLYCDPVKLVQAAAKRLQVKALHKLLDKYYYRDGVICLKESATHVKNLPPQWDRSQLPELVDTNVRSKDGVLVPAHKCILAARLDYFHGMFMHSWTESQQLSTVTLPINHGILTPVINFLYTDACPEVQSSDSIDFICSMLVVADQLFITRLREMCEVALSNLVTLRNCAELCQFAHTYNATQLKQCCMEFISLNIASMLENRCLDILEDTLLEDITNYYCKFNPIMSSRIITPFYNAPDDEIINEYVKTCPVDLDVIDEDLKRENSVSEVSKKKRNSKKIEYTESEKARMRYESVSSVTSLDLSNETNDDIHLSLSKTPKDTEKGMRDAQTKWIEVPSSQKQQKLVQARLKAISTAKEISNEKPTESFTKLSKSNSFTSPYSNVHDNSAPNTSRMSVSPKDSPILETARSPQGNVTISHVGPKLSQKQRKKLALQDPSQGSLNESFASKLNMASPPEVPKNPWKISQVPVASTSVNKAKVIEFNQIQADQKKQKDDFSRIMTKPLNLTQLEDKAIEELEKFYNIHEVDDELITVKRIELQVSAPQWVHTAIK